MLNLYRRHQPPCRYTSRRYRNCSCPIWVRGLAPHVGQRDRDHRDGCARERGRERKAHAAQGRPLHESNVDQDGVDDLQVESTSSALARSLVSIC